MQYRSKEVVEAIQYTGSNEEEIVSFLKKNLNISEDYPTKIKKEDNLLKILFNGKFGKVEHFIANCEYYVSFGMRHVEKLSKSNFEDNYSINMSDKQVNCIMDMPTFEDIKLGRCVYKVPGRYLGVDDNGGYRYAKSRHMDVCVKHNYYDCLFKLYIGLDRKSNPISLYWQPSFVHTYKHEFDYSEEGYEQLKADIAKELKWLIDLANKMLNKGN